MRIWKTWNPRALGMQKPLWETELPHGPHFTSGYTPKRLKIRDLNKYWLINVQSIIHSSQKGETVPMPTDVRGRMTETRCARLTPTLLPTTQPQGGREPRHLPQSG